MKLFLIIAFMSLSVNLLISQEKLFKRGKFLQVLGGHFSKEWKTQREVKYELVKNYSWYDPIFGKYVWPGYLARDARQVDLKTFYVMDGIAGTGDEGEGDGVPTRGRLLPDGSLDPLYPGEPNFEFTDLDESDMIGLTSFNAMMKTSYRTKIN